MSTMDKFTELAKANLDERGVSNPSADELRREMLTLHIQEAASLAGLVGEGTLAKKLEGILKKLAG